MTAHSKYFSPSSIFRRILCTGSAELEAQVTEPEGPKPAADWGTYAHHMAETFFTKDIPPTYFRNKEMFGQVCDEEMVSCALSFIEDTYKATSGVGAPILCEQTVHMPGYKHVYGTADIICKSRDTLVVLDYKSGKYPVSPRWNPQLMTYALCAGLDGINNVKICISQPRSSLGDVSLKIWETTADEIIRWFRAKLVPVIEAILAGDPTLTAGDEQCQWCRAKGICPEYTKVALAEFDYQEIGPPVIDDDLVARVYPHIKMMKAWIKQVEAHAYKQAEQKTLAGYKLVAGRKKRSWINEEDAAFAMRTLFMEPYENKILSPAKAEKEVRKDQKPMLQGYIKVETGPPVIVPESDKRESIDSLDSFKEIPEDQGV